MAKTKRNSSSSSSARRRNDRDDPERAALLPTVPTDSGGSERPVDVFALVHHVRHLLKVRLSWLMELSRRVASLSRLTKLCCRRPTSTRL